jgi:hypothetical protein
MYRGLLIVLSTRHNGENEKLGGGSTAGEKAFNKVGSWLPDETMDASVVAW